MTRGQRRVWIALEEQNRRRARQPKGPIAPANLNAVDNSTLIELTWQDKSADELGFRIYRKVEAGAFGLWQTVGPSVTLVQDAGVVATVLYSYYVTAYNALGESAPSNISSVRFGAA